MRFHVLLAACLIVLTIGCPISVAQTFVAPTEAPGLDIEEWLLGEETTIEKDQVYIVAFFKLAERPTREFLRKLSKLQNEYGPDGLTVIAISGDNKYDLEQFVRTNESTLDICIALDRRTNTDRAWRNVITDAVDERGEKIDRSWSELSPILFLVDRRGLIQLFANTTEHHLFEELFGMVMDGRYDTTLWHRTDKIRASIESARKAKNWRVCENMINEVIDTDKHIFAYYTLKLFEISIVDQKDKQKAYDYARKLIEEYSDDPKVLADLARKIATDPLIAPADRDLEVAMLAAKAAAASFPSDEPQALSIQALVHFHQGHVEEAITLQKKAYFLARPSRKAAFKRVLDTYQQGAVTGANADMQN